MALTQADITRRTGLSKRSIGVLLSAGALCREGRHISGASLGELRENEHYVVCRECGKWLIQVSQHLPSCCGMTVAEYVEKYPGTPVMSSLSEQSRAKTDAQRTAQSETLKARFKTPEGERTRRQIAEASRRLHDSGYREKAATHLRSLNDSPAQRKRLRGQTLARWNSGELREVVEGWHRDNREESLASAANARRHIKRKRSKLHLRFKAAMVAAGIGGFETEHEVGFYSIDEGCPDLKVAVEVDGCYFHGCEKCGHPGLGVNKALDRRKTTYLTRRGWVVVRVREHEIRADINACVERVWAAVKALEQRGAA